MKGKLFRFSAGNSRKNGQQVPGKFTSSKQWRRKSISSFKTHSPRVEMPWKCSKLQPLFPRRVYSWKMYEKGICQPCQVVSFHRFPHFFWCEASTTQAEGGCSYGFFLKTQKKSKFGPQKFTHFQGWIRPTVDPCCSCGFANIENKVYIKMFQEFQAICIPW